MTEASALSPLAIPFQLAVGMDQTPILQITCQVSQRILSERTLLATHKRVFSETRFPCRNGIAILHAKLMPITPLMWIMQWNQEAEVKHLDEKS